MNMKKIITQRSVLLRYSVMICGEQTLFFRLRLFWFQRPAHTGVAFHFTCFSPDLWITQAAEADIS